MAQVNSADGLLLFFVAFPCPCNSSVAKIGPKLRRKIHKGAQKKYAENRQPVYPRMV
jgi:hypothetical protein